MFERRLKFFLAILVAVTGLLVVRTAQVQVVQKEDWRSKADEAAKASRPTETVRGQIKDVRGNVIATDRPCIDACIAFPAISDPPDEAWVRSFAEQRLKGRMRDAYDRTPRSKKKELVTAEAEQVKADIASMWSRLEHASGRPLAQILETRSDVLNKVELRRRSVRFHSFQKAVKQYEERDPPPAWRRWLIGEASEPPTKEQIVIQPLEEEIEAHPILLAISTETQNELRKHIEDFPGLVLRPGVQRFYPFPYGEAGCHLIGHLARVSREDLLADPNLGKSELRYFPNDLIGRTGLEKLAEPLLRGSRGHIDMIDGNTEVDRVESVPGADVITTIDMDFQQDVVNMFRYAKVHNPGDPPDKKPEIVPMHGAAVVIDVPTGEIRVLASYPTYDLNEFDEKFAILAADELNTPLFNRATQDQLVPGSTVKPIVGMGAITDGKIGVNQGIECTGYLVIGGKRVNGGFRCWTVSKWADLPPSQRPPPEHHQVPYGDPHHGHDGNADGFLTFSDALQRSCNVYFETLGNELRADGLTTWYARFGLGRKTGIGIPEKQGYLPMSRFSILHREGVAWHSAIGQVGVAVTPLQMANVAATIARDGVWMRPKLVRETSLLPPLDRPDREDLHIDPAAVAAAKEGMIRVVNSRAGTGGLLKREDMEVAGKTGTATASPLRITVRDDSGEPMLDSEGKPMKETLRPSTPQEPNPAARWYRGDGKTLNHAWFIGFAPADNPRVAFAVLIEYGVSGGVAAGSVASELLDACVERGYLPRKKTDVAMH